MLFFTFYVLRFGVFCRRRYVLTCPAGGLLLKALKEAKVAFTGCMALRVAAPLWQLPYPRARPDGPSLAPQAFPRRPAAPTLGSDNCQSQTRRRKVKSVKALKKQYR